MMSSKQMKEVRRGSLTLIQDGSKGGPGGLNDLLESHSFFSSLLTRRRNEGGGPICPPGQLSEVETQRGFMEGGL